MAHMAYESAILAQGPRHRCWTDHRDFDPCDLRSRADLCSSYLSSSEIWWTWSGSNRRPLPCHGSALPTAPQAHLLKGKTAQTNLDTLNSRLPVRDSQTWSRKLHLLCDRLCEIVENGYPVDGRATKS